MSTKDITYLWNTIFLDKHNKNEQSKYKYYISRKPMAKMKTKRIKPKHKYPGIFLRYLPKK